MPDEPRFEKVHEDARGEIYRVVLPPDFEIMLFHCKAGYKRGGHRHTVPERVALLQGRMNYHKVIDGKPEVAEKRPGDVMLNLPDEPHMGEFLEDSWVAEWKFGPNAGIGKWETIDHEPLRVQTRPQLLPGVMPHVYPPSGAQRCARCGVFAHDPVAVTGCLYSDTAAASKG